MVFRCGRIWPLLAGARAGVRPHCLCEVATLGRRPFATGALLGEVGRCAPRRYDFLVAARTLAVGALCAPDGRCAQRHDAAAAILRNGRPRARYRPETAKKYGLVVRVVADGTQNAERRMRENAAIAALTREKLTQRAASV